MKMKVEKIGRTIGSELEAFLSCIHPALLFLRWLVEIAKVNF